VFQQPHRLWSQERLGPSRRRAPDLPGHHGPLHRLPGAVAQRSRRLRAAATHRLADHHRRRALSRHQDPRDARDPPARSALARLNLRRRLDGQRNPCRCPRHVPSVRSRLWPEPAALRPAQAQGPRIDRARRLALRLPPHRKRRPGRAARGSQSRRRFVYNRSGKNLRFFADCCCEKGAPSGQLASRPHCITVPFMSDGLSTLYQDLLSGSYDCVDRIVLNAYFRMGHDPGGFRLWWRQLTGSDATLDNAHVMRLAGRFGRRIRGYAKVNDIPVVNCSAGERKHDIAEDYLARTTITQGLFLVLVGRAQAPVWDVTANHHIEKKKPMPYVNHYSFHILDAEWGHITIKISGHPPFPAQIMLNGHEYVACQARKAGITFTKQGNCFTNVSRAAALAKIAETLSEPRTIGRLSQLCDRWIYSACLCFALDLEEQRLSGFRYQYSNYQIEYSRNLIFAVGGHMEQV